MIEMNLQNSKGLTDLRDGLREDLREDNLVVAGGKGG